MRKNNNIRGYLFDNANAIFLSILAISFLLPFWFVLTTSMVSEQERIIRGNFIFFPKVLDFHAYTVMLRKGSDVYSGYNVTMFRTIFGTTLNMIVTASIAYGLAKKTLPFRNLLTFGVFFTTIFSGGMIPNYLLIRYMGLYDSVWALILPSLVNVWWMLLVRNFFMQIPESIEEAAIIDGASPLKILVSIIFPLSIPVIATIGMFYAVWHWNSWFDAFLYISNPKKMPMQNVLRQIIQASNVEKNFSITDATVPPLESIKAATIVMTTVPIVCVYPFIQRYFVKGVVVGGVKG